METQAQKTLVKLIFKAKNQILESADRKEIISLIDKVIDASEFVPPAYHTRFNNRSYLDHLRNSVLTLLRMDRGGVTDGSLHDFEFIHFQIASTLMMLISVYAEDGFDGAMKILNEHLIQND